MEKQFQSRSHSSRWRPCRSAEVSLERVPGDVCHGPVLRRMGGHHVNGAMRHVEWHPTLSAWLLYATFLRVPVPGQPDAGAVSVPKSVGADTERGAPPITYHLDERVGVERFRESSVRGFAEGVLRALGASAEEARINADGVVTASLWWHPGQHQGLEKLFRYARRMRNGGIVPDAPMTWVRERRPRRCSMRTRDSGMWRRGGRWTGRWRWRGGSGS